MWVLFEKWGCCRGVWVPTTQDCFGGRRKEDGGKDREGSGREEREWGSGTAVVAVACWRGDVIGCGVLVLGVRFYLRFCCRLRLLPALVLEKEGRKGLLGGDTLRGGWGRSYQLAHSFAICPTVINIHNWEDCGWQWRRRRKGGSVGACAIPSSECA